MENKTLEQLKELWIEKIIKRTEMQSKHTVKILNIDAELNKVRKEILERGASVNDIEIYPEGE